MRYRSSMRRLSTVHLFNKQHEEAIAAARRWIALEPSNADAYATLAGALHFASDNEEVFGLIDKAIAASIRIIRFFYPHYIGFAHLAMHRFDDAARAFERAVTRSPDAIMARTSFWRHAGAIWARTKRPATKLPKSTGSIRNFSVAALAELLAYKNRADLDLLVNGLGLAGLTP